MSLHYICYVFLSKKLSTSPRMITQHNQTKSQKFNQTSKGFFCCVRFKPLVIQCSNQMNDTHNTSCYSSSYRVSTWPACGNMLNVLLELGVCHRGVNETVELIYKKRQIYRITHCVRQLILNLSVLNSWHSIALWFRVFLYFLLFLWFTDCKTFFPPLFKFGAPVVV